MKAAEAPWLSILSDSAERVQSLVAAVALSGERGKVVGEGASGDMTLAADEEAERELLRALGKVDGLRIISEEAGDIGDPGGKFIAVVDPLDGSANFERGIPFYCTSVAISEGPKLEDVRFGLVRNLVNGDVYWAEKGKGASKNGKPIHPSEREDPKASVVDVDLSRGDPKMVARLGRLIAGVKRQVHFGANALELCLLAEGRFDSFVDLRGRMRPTDFAAAYLVSLEAGAVVTDGMGGGLNPGLGLGEKFSFVASGNESLHRRILGLCQKS